MNEQTIRGALAPIMEFALGFQPDGVQLLRRHGAAWAEQGKAPFDGDLRGALGGFVQRLRAANAPGLALVIPADQILYTDLVLPKADSTEAALRVALDGLTPYRVEDLAFDYAPADAVPGAAVKVAAVARQTLLEAEDFAVRHGFAPDRFIAAPLPEQFPQSPDFGATELAAEWLRAAALATGIVIEPPAAPAPVAAAAPERGADPVLSRITPHVVAMPAAAVVVAPELPASVNLGSIVLADDEPAPAAAPAPRAAPAPEAAIAPIAENIEPAAPKGNTARAGKVLPDRARAFHERAQAARQVRPVLAAPVRTPPAPGRRTGLSGALPMVGLLVLGLGIAAAMSSRDPAPELAAQTGTAPPAPPPAASVVATVPRSAAPTVPAPVAVATQPPAAVAPVTPAPVAAATLPPVAPAPVAATPQPPVTPAPVAATPQPATAAVAAPIPTVPAAEVAAAMPQPPLANVAPAQGALAVAPVAGAIPADPAPAAAVPPPAVAAPEPNPLVAAPGSSAEVVEAPAPVPPAPARTAPATARPAAPVVAHPAAVASTRPKSRPADLARASTRMPAPAVTPSRPAAVAAAPAARPASRPDDKPAKPVASRSPGAPDSSTLRSSARPRNAPARGTPAAASAAPDSRPAVPPSPQPFERRAQPEPTGTRPPPKPSASTIRGAALHLQPAPYFLSIFTQQGHAEMQARLQRPWQMAQALPDIPLIRTAELRPLRKPTRSDAVDSAVAEAMAVSRPAARASTAAPASAGATARPRATGQGALAASNRPQHRPSGLAGRSGAGAASTSGLSAATDAAVEEAIAAAVSASAAVPGRVPLTALTSSARPLRRSGGVLASAAPTAAGALAGIRSQEGTLAPEPDANAGASKAAAEAAALAERRRLDEELQRQAEQRTRDRAAADARAAAQAKAAAEARARAQAEAEAAAAARQKQTYRPPEVDNEPEVAAAPSGPTSASVASSATNRGIDLNATQLIGTVGAGKASRGLVRLRSGKIVTVRLGDKINGGQITQIGNGGLQYVKAGKQYSLPILNGR